MKNLKVPGRNEPWNVLELYQGQNEEETLENLADFFNELSAEFDELEEADIPPTYDREIYEISADSVGEMIRKIKKPKSMVPGDLPPRLVNELSNYCA